MPARMAAAVSFWRTWPKERQHRRRLLLRRLPRTTLRRYLVMRRAVTCTSTTPRPPATAMALPPPRCRAGARRLLPTKARRASSFAAAFCRTELALAHRLALGWRGLILGMRSRTSSKMARCPLSLTMKTMREVCLIASHSFGAHVSVAVNSRVDPRAQGTLFTKSHRNTSSGRFELCSSPLARKARTTQTKRWRNPKLHEEWTRARKPCVSGYRWLALCTSDAVSLCTSLCLLLQVRFVPSYLGSASTSCFLAGVAAAQKSHESLQQELYGACATCW